MTDNLKVNLNLICSYLAMGESWHRKAANECRKLALRGFGRWHESEAMGDSECLMCLEKLLMDKLMFSPVIDIAMIDQAEKYTMSTHSDFKSHFGQWAEREEKLIKALNEAIHESRTEDMELYNKLCCTVDEVQNELMRAKMTYARLDLASWAGHDIGVCSKWLHDYFEHEYSGGKIDYNIG